MNFLKTIRSAEWWEYKLPPLLSIGYATAIKADYTFLKSIPQLLFLLLSLIIGAIFVSIINDMTDIEEDLISEKSNRMANINPSLRWILLFFCLLAGAICCYNLFPDQLSVFLYIIPWISFSLYSFRPIRLKNRRIWGVLADASGSHIFTSLLMVSSISFFTKQNIDWLWFASTGIWALCYGMRGILWHQFYDRLNDIKAGVKTFVVKIEPESFKVNETIIFTLEVLAMLVMLYCLHQILPILFLFVYLLLAFTRTYKLGYDSVLIVAPYNKPYHILMADFYQIFFPISLLITATIFEPYTLIVLIIHLALFPNKTIIALKDLKFLIISK